MIFINRICQKPVDSCFCCCLSDVSVKNTEAVAMKSSVKRCSLELPKIYRKLQAGGLQFYKKDSDQGLFQTFIACGTCTQCPVSIFAGIFTLQKIRIDMLFRGVSSLSLSFFIHTTCMPCLSKICPADTGVFWRTLQSFLEHPFCRTTTNSCFRRRYFLHMFFQLKVPLFTNNFTQVMFS